MLGSPPSWYVLWAQHPGIPTSVSAMPEQTVPAAHLSHPQGALGSAPGPQAPPPTSLMKECAPSGLSSRMARRSVSR